MELLATSLEYKAFLARQWWEQGCRTERAADRRKTRDPVAWARCQVEEREQARSRGVLARWIERSVNEPARAVGRQDLTVPLALPASSLPASPAEEQARAEAKARKAEKKRIKKWRRKCGFSKAGF